MNDDLLPFYNRELAFFRKMAGQFAETNPKIAGRLRLSAETCDDPHVERLIEAFAFLNARIRHKLDDDFPELTDALLGSLYPHYLAPIPSMAVVKMEMDAQQVAPAGYYIPQGSPIETEPIQGEPCRFRTSYDVTAWPFEVRTASLSGRPLPAPRTPRSSDAVAVLRIQLQCFSEEVTFADVEAKSLRFFLKGLSHHVLPLYELIFNNTLEVAIATSPNDPDPVVLPASCLQPVGFVRDESLLPDSPRSQLAYRLLTEYFVFPQKFLFFNVTGFDAGRSLRTSQNLELYLYLNQTSRDLERNVGPDTFQLNCTPIVNLFPQRAEPITLTPTRNEHTIVPDARRPESIEVYSVDSVAALSPLGDEVELKPFYAADHDRDPAEDGAYWYAGRNPGIADEGEEDNGTDMSLILVGLDFQPHAQADWTVDVQTTCINRDLPNRLPFGGDQPVLSLTEGAGAVSRVRCLTPPTPTRRPERRHAAYWRLVSHLSMNHLSLTGGEDGARALREILRLYDFTNAADTRDVIDSLISISSRRVAGRISSNGMAGIGRGVEIQLEFRSDSYSEKGLYLFARVLDHFLAQSCSINSFTKMTATLRGREGRWLESQPRAGDRILV